MQGSCPVHGGRSAKRYGHPAADVLCGKKRSENMEFNRMHRGLSLCICVG
mgnify:CR=1